MTNALRPTTQPELLERLQDLQDEEAWEHFFQRYRRMLFNTAHRSGLSEADAEDVVQESLITITRSIPEFIYDPKRGRFKTWLLTILRSRLIDHLRGRQRREARQHRYAELNEPNPPGPMTDELEGVWEQEWQDYLAHQALKRLEPRVKPDQLEIYRRHVLEGADADTVALELKVTRQQVYLAKLRVGSLFQATLRRVEAQEF